eukprot:11968338-Alexandrium_andersonii.AAC.1
MPKSSAPQPTRVEAAKALEEPRVADFKRGPKLGARATRRKYGHHHILEQFKHHLSTSWHETREPRSQKHLRYPKSTHIAPAHQ